MKLLVLFLMSLHVTASVPDKLSAMKCAPQIERVLNQLKSIDRWTETVNPQPGVSAFRSRTKSFAKWVEIQSFENPYLLYFEPTKSQVFQWSGKTCMLMGRTETKPLSFLTKEKNGFTDEKLKTLFEGKKDTMVYIWSPTMAYSMREMVVFKKVAQEMNLDFIPVLSFHESSAHAKELISGYQPDLPIQKLQSLELIMREGMIHFPSTFIVGNKRFSQRIFGAMPADLLKERIRRELMVVPEETR